MSLDRFTQGCGCRSESCTGSMMRHQTPHQLVWSISDAFGCWKRLRSFSCRFGAIASPHTDRVSMKTPMNSALTWATSRAGQVRPDQTADARGAAREVSDQASQGERPSILAFWPPPWSAIVKMVSPPQIIPANA